MPMYSRGRTVAVDGEVGDLGDLDLPVVVHRLTVVGDELVLGGEALGVPGGGTVRGGVLVEVGLVAASSLIRSSAGRTALEISTPITTTSTTTPAMMNGSAAFQDGASPSGACGVGFRSFAMRRILSAVHPAPVRQDQPARTAS